MSRLYDLYKAIETMRREHLSTADLEAKVSLAEEEIIKNEILPVLKQNIEPALQPVKRELVLVVEYHPGEPLSVALSRKTKISEIIDAKTLTPKVGKPVKSAEKPAPIEPHEPTKKVTNHTKGLKVEFPDGTIVCRKTAIDTEIEVLRIIGFEAAASVGRMRAGWQLIGKKKRPIENGKVWQHEADGWYIYSNTQNNQKKEDLQAISDALHLNLIISDGKP